MTESRVRLLSAATPLVGLAVLTFLFWFSVKAYARCEFTKLMPCEPLASRINQILGPYTLDINKVVAGDSDEVKKTKAAREPEHIALRTSGRLMFMFFAMVYFLVCLVTCGVGIYVLWRALEEATQHPRKLAAAAIIISLAFGIYLYSNPIAYMSVFSALFNNRVSLEAGGVNFLLRLVNSFGFAVCLLVALAVSAVLYAPKDTSNPEGLHKLARRMKYLRVVLYVGTMMLIVGVLLIRSIYHWSLIFMVRDPIALKAAEAFFANLLAAEGGFFTLVLAVAYLPAAMILRHQADSISGLPQIEAEKEKKLQDYNLAFSFTQSLPRLAAILGPLLVGPIGELVTRLAPG